MSPESDGTAVLVEVATEWEANLIADTLRDHGVDAEAAGALTAGFRAEVPGLVRVIVKESDLARAREVLAGMRDEVADIDWDNIDIGQPEPE